MVLLGCGLMRWVQWFDVGLGITRFGYGRGKKKALAGMRGLWGSSLTMSYFHTGIRTIIGAEAFHGPVRDGKEWDHLAMVIRL